MSKLVLYKANCRWLFLLEISLIAMTLLSMAFFDRPVYLWFKEYWSQNKFNVAKLKGSNWLYDFITAEFSLIMFVGFALLVVVLKSYLAENKKFLTIFAIYQVIWLVVINYSQALLKYFFGRCVSSICFLPDVALLTNQYGFIWLSSVSGFASFPSGHCTFMSFCLFWIILLDSKLRLVIGAIFILLFCGLVAFNYHFLSDCLAGTALGLFFCGLSYWFWCYIMQHFNLGYE